MSRGVFRADCVCMHSFARRCTLFLSFPEKKRFNCIYYLLIGIIIMLRVMRLPPCHTDL